MSDVLYISIANQIRQQSKQIIDHPELIDHGVDQISDLWAKARLYGVLDQVDQLLQEWTKLEIEAILEGLHMKI